MAKGEQTRQVILQQAAQIFSMNGYAGTSLDDLMTATRLTKGGIYNHFDNKEALSLAAFDYAVELVRERFRESLAGKRTTRTRLRAVIDLFYSLLIDPLFAGGCILLNTAIEADDTSPVLRERTQKAFDDWRQTIMRTMNKGLELGDVRPGTDPEVAATIFISTLEGAIMLSKLYGDTVHLRRAADHLSAYVDSFIQEPTA